MAGESYEKMTLRSPIWAALLILFTFTVYSLSKLVILMLEPSVVLKPAEIASVTAPTEQTRHTPNYSFSFDPFYRETPTSEAEDMGEDVPETNVNIKLVGRILGPNGGAILQTPNGRQARYGVEEEIIDGVTLKSVQRDFVIIDQNGRRERLSIVRSGNEANRLIKSAQTQQSLGTLGNPQADRIFSSINFRPVLSNGSFKGFQVTPKSPSVKLSEYGLRSGDIITKIGAVDLTIGRPQIQDVKTELQSGKSVMVTVSRNGQRVRVRLGQ
jgi:type II secretion system protein C